jgi:hypothetical protein
MALTKIGSSGITANALTSLAIANGTIQAVDLADGAVTNDKLAGSITSGKITSVANTAITGLVTSAQIASVANTQVTGLINTAQIANAAITTALIANAAITTALIANNSIITDDIVDRAITAAKIANTAVTAGIYGGSSNSALITIDAQGRVTAASNVAVAGGVTSLNGQTGAITNTSLYAIGSYIIGRPQNSTNYAADSTIAGSSLYSNMAGRNADIQVGCSPTWGSVFVGQRNAGIAEILPTAVLINTGTWRCITQAVGDGCIAASGLWVRTA